MPKKTNKSAKNKPRSSQKNTESAKGKSRTVRSDRNHKARQRNDQEDKHTSPRDIFCDFAGTTSRVVQKATSILEEEIAAGIVAAKQVENKFTNVKELRTGKPEALMQRFRKDTHEIADILLDLVSLAAKYSNKFAQRVITVKGIKQKGDRSDTATSQIPTLEMPKPIKPGSSDKVKMTLENETHQTTDELSVHCTDLVSTSGERILSKHVTFTPPSIKIGALKSKKITVTVKIPKETCPGIYSGLIQATNVEQLHAILIVQVD